MCQSLWNVIQTAAWELAHPPFSDFNLSFILEDTHTLPFFSSILTFLGLLPHLFFFFIFFFVFVLLISFREGRFGGGVMDVFGAYMLYAVNGLGWMLQLIVVQCSLSRKFIPKISQHTWVWLLCINNLNGNQHWWNLSASKKLPS